MRHAFTGRHERCYMKLLVDDASDRVLAVHMLGADAPEIVQSLAVAMTAGATKAHFDSTVAVHPTRPRSSCCCARRSGASTEGQVPRRASFDAPSTR